MLCKQAVGVSRDLIDHRIGAPGPLLLWWRTLGTGAMVKAGGDLLKIWVRMGVYWSAQAFRQEGEGPSGPGAFLGPVYTTFWVKMQNFKAIVAVTRKLNDTKTGFRIKSFENASTSFVKTQSRAVGK